MVKTKYSNLKSSKIKEFLRVYFLSGPLFRTKSASEKVLDLGCGWGFYFKINPLAFGIDFDEKCINYLKNLGLKVVQGDITKHLPFGNDSFEQVIACDVLEHFELKEVKKIFSGVQRILEKGGTFFISIPNKKGFDLGLKKNVGHKHFITINEILDISKDNFALKDHFSHPLPKVIGDYFSHNKEIIILQKIK